MKETIIGTIKIVNPYGVAPDWIHRAWIGIVIPAIDIPKEILMQPMNEAPERLDTIPEENVFIVKTVDALGALIQKNKMAHRWWLEAETLYEYFIFFENECEFHPVTNLT